MLVCFGLVALASININDPLQTVHTDEAKVEVKIKNVKLTLIHQDAKLMARVIEKGSFGVWVCWAFMFMPEFFVVH